MLTAYLRIHRILCLPLFAGLIVFSGVSAAEATTYSFSILNSGGSGGSGATTSDMIFNQYTSGDGWGWAGGAGGVQGSLAVTNTGGYAAPSNETFKFNIGATVDALNTTYGAGNWTIENLTFSFKSSYNLQNNSRFGRGSGTFDIYWVENDNWAQSKGTSSDRGLNPVYASTADALASWAGNASLLGSETFDCTGSGYVSLTYALSSTSSVVSDILSASSSTNSNLSLYLMGTSDTLGMIIFTGGQGQSLPTISFDVTPVPEPAACAVAMGLLCGVGIWRRRRAAKKSALSPAGIAALPKK